MSKAPFMYGVLGDVEGTYGGGASLSASTDGVLVVDEPRPELGYLFDGTRGNANAAPGTGATLVRAAPQGLGAEVAIVQDFAGPAAAYSSSVASSIDLFMRLSGHSKTVDTTGGSEKITYAPVNLAGTWDSGFLEVYIDGEQTDISGLYADMEVAAEGPEVPLFTFASMGIGVLEVDIALPTITYAAQTLIPPAAVSMDIDIGTYAVGVVRSFAFRKNQAFSPRANQNVTGHGGFAPGRRNPELEVTVEKTALVNSPFHTTAGLDPRQLRAAGTLIAVDLQIGTVQYNRLKLTAANAQLVDVADDADGDVALWVLTFELKPSTVAGTDDYAWVTD